MVSVHSGFLSREKTSTNFAFLWRFAKVFSVKTYFQAIKYRASGRGALGYHKFAKVFSAKIIYLQAIRERFLPLKKPAILYMCNVCNVQLALMFVQHCYKNIL